MPKLGFIAYEDILVDTIKGRFILIGMSTHADIIDQLGGPKAVREKLANRAGLYISAQAICGWKSKGISWRARPLVGVLAREAGIPLPDGFLPEELLQPIPNEQGEPSRTAGEAA